MILPMIRGRARRLGLGVAALAATVPLALVISATANAASANAESIQYIDIGSASAAGSTATIDNTATASATDNGQRVFAESVKFPISSAADIAANNTASATSGSPGSDAISIAFQMISATQPGINNLTAVDTAEATATCNSCQALAEAFQIVYTPGLLIYSAGLGEQEQLLQDDLSWLQWSGASNSFIQSESTQYVENFMAWLQENYGDGSVHLLSAFYH